MLTQRLIQRLGPSDRIAFGQRASVVGIICNLVLVVLKGVAGIASGSISVVADAINNLLDAASNIVSLVGYRLANKPADKQHPYGHGRYEYLAGLVVAMIVVVTGTELVHQSVVHALRPVDVNFAAPVIASLVVSILAKLWLMAFDTQAGDAIDSTPLRAAAQDSRNDALATGTVLVGALISNATGLRVDGFLGVGVGLFIVIGGYNLLRDTMNPLLGDRPDPELVERVRERILSYPEVISTHDLLIHDYGPNSRFASAHVEMAAEADPFETHAVIDRIERDLRETEGLATIIHYDPVVTSDVVESDLRTRVDEAVRRVDERLSVHDLSETREDDRHVLAFDCVRPPELDMDDEELAAAIEDEVHLFAPNATCHITFDDGFAASVH